ncbi:ATP-grasp domain-containing protein [Dactylosporangium vinaceum]|uniref:ATP-grasp domain-containing protein n=1 Tax=Dactylosporangium vinaceum TaxID=53362 RepID=A0ABV5MCS9_9ACTN|nr:ATP-grasp domain-containing protein [Dactylosporangium vinaceum]UAC00715.1 ATP-grasp domain-containing protein [Dactylosporangium vinaceum]
MSAAVSGPDFLLLPPRPDSTAERLAAAARRRGLAVEPCPDGRVPVRLRGRDGGHLYGGPAFAATVGADLDLALLEPADDWLPGLPAAFRGRDIVLSTLGEARWSRTPAFVKQPRDKELPAAVYADGSRLPGPGRLAADTPVLISEVVTFVVEYRLFVLDATVHAAGRYATFGRLDPAPLDGDAHRSAVLAFAGELLAACAGSLPSAVVVDVGLAADPDRGDERWAVVEANMAWFSTCYAADPDRVLDVVLRAAGPRHRAAARDHAFVRPGGERRREPPPEGQDIRNREARGGAGS